MALLVFVVGFVFVLSAIVTMLLPASIRALLPDAKQDVALPPRYAWSALIVALAFNVFAYAAHAPAFGAGAFAALSIVAVFIALPAPKQTFFASTMAVVGVLAAMAWSWRANGFVQGVNLAVVLVSVSSLAFVHAVQRIEWNGAWLLRTAFLYPMMLVSRMPAIARLAKPGKLTRVSLAARVSVITIVLVLFFAAILSGADPIFAEKISVLREEIVPRTAWAVFLAVLLAVPLGASFGTGYPHEKVPLRFLSWIETVVPVGAVCVLFGIFLWVQATYLFADHDSFRALDLTYAEYVRKGMIELLVATFFAGVLSYVVSLKEREAAHPRERAVLYGVNAVLIVELFLMLGSALRRDWMYMDVYGLTRVRVIGEIFLAWLAVVILLFAAFALWRRLREKGLFAGVIVACVAVVAYLNVTNMDARIASAAVPDGQAKDAFYLSLLSTDAAGEWETLIGDMALEFETFRSNPDPDEGERARIANLVRAVEELAWERDVATGFNEPKAWPDWTWSRARAVRIMSGSTAFRETLPCLETQLANYRLRNNIRLENDIATIEGDYTRPFVAGPSSYDSVYVSDYSPRIVVGSCV